MAGATLTIAALAFIAGTIGAWLVYTDLRDSKRRFEAISEMFGDFPHVPDEAKVGGQLEKPGGGAGNTPAADAQDTVALHVGGAPTP